MLKGSRDGDNRIFEMVFVSAVVLVLSAGAAAAYISCDGHGWESHSEARGLTPNEEDCVRGAPAECVRATIESSGHSDFYGYIFCACVTAGGGAKGFIVPNTDRFPADDTKERTNQREPFGNDNPAVVFPVGEAHR